MAEDRNELDDNIASLMQLTEMYLRVSDQNDSFLETDQGEISYSVQARRHARARFIQVFHALLAQMTHYPNGDVVSPAARSLLEYTLWYRLSEGNEDYGLKVLHKIENSRREGYEEKKSLLTSLGHEMPPYEPSYPDLPEAKNLPSMRQQTEALADSSSGRRIHKIFRELSNLSVHAADKSLAFDHKTGFFNLSPDWIDAPKSFLQVLEVFKIFLGNETIDTPIDELLQKHLEIIEKSLKEKISDRYLHDNREKSIYQNIEKPHSRLAARRKGDEISFFCYDMGTEKAFPTEVRSKDSFGEDVELTIKAIKVIMYEISEGDLVLIDFKSNSRGGFDPHISEQRYIPSPSRFPEIIAAPHVHSGLHTLVDLKHRAREEDNLQGILSGEKQAVASVQSIYKAGGGLSLPQPGDRITPPSL